ncbi:MAG: VOC family protein [Acidobacteriota bacterium]|nr:VOC family protein [Acidobacteriota bacterium]
MRFLLLVFLFSFLTTATAFAQLTPTNEAGVTIGHVHWLTPNPEAHKKLWVDLFGAQVTNAGALEIIKLPGIVILINPPQPGAVPGEPTADHIAFAVRDLAETKKKLASANIRFSSGSDIADFPDGVRVEFIEDKSLKVPIAFHHFHIYTADADALRDWYVRIFGGVKFPDGHDFPGGEVRFTAQQNPPRVPSKGHTFDHISFEIKNLDEFCENLKARGVKLDMDIIDATKQIGLKVTFVTDPAGTRIELTEGLADK